MKPGTASIAAYYVSCPRPDCETPLSDPSTGSFLIGRDSVDAFRRIEPTLTAKGQIIVKCDGCGVRFVLPAAVSRLAP